MTQKELSPEYFQIKNAPVVSSIVEAANKTLAASEETRAKTLAILLEFQKFFAPNPTSGEFESPLSTPAWQYNTKLVGEGQTPQFIMDMLGSLILASGPTRKKFEEHYVTVAAENQAAVYRYILETIAALQA